jgi:hypothetical protein
VKLIEIYLNIYKKKKPVEMLIETKSKTAEGKSNKSIYTQTYTHIQTIINRVANERLS